MVLELGVEVEERPDEHDEGHDEVEEGDRYQTPLELDTVAGADQQSLGGIQPNN